MKMLKLNKSNEKENIVPSTTPTLVDVRAQANALRGRLTQDKFEAAAFKASPKAVLAEHASVLADVRQVAACSVCHTTCGVTCKVTNVCGRTSR
jgi:hypothetical protein